MLPMVNFFEIKLNYKFGKTEINNTLPNKHKGSQLDLFA